MLEVFFFTNDATLGVEDVLGELELGFDEHDEESAGDQECPEGLEEFCKGNEGNVDNQEVVGGVGEIFWGEGFCVGLFEVKDAGIGGNFGMELTVTDINAGDMGGAVLEEEIGKSPGGCTDIDAGFAFYGEGVECGVAFEFFTGPADVFLGDEEL